MAGPRWAIDLNRYRASAIAAVAVAAVVAAAAILYYSGPAPEAVVQPPPTALDVVAVITVHVSGAVLTPGLVEVVFDARVADVVAAAGGSSALANLAALNLAAPVRDGEHVVVPTLGDRSVEADGEERLIRLNTASASELEQIPGVGPVLAARIVDARQAVGGFTTVEDLLDVSGIGEAKLAALREYVVVP